MDVTKTSQTWTLCSQISHIQRPGQQCNFLTANLHVIPYSDHEEVRTFLEALQAGDLDYTLKKRADR